MCPPDNMALLISFVKWCPHHPAHGNATGPQKRHEFEPSMLGKRPHVHGGQRGPLVSPLHRPRDVCLYHSHCCSVLLSYMQPWLDLKVSPSQLRSIMYPAKTRANLTQKSQTSLTVWASSVLVVVMLGRRNNEMRTAHTLWSRNHRCGKLSSMWESFSYT